jgi:hypothetical protein
MRFKSLRGIALIGALALATGCAKGGQLTLEPGARITKSKGTAFVSVTLGGKAFIVEQGQTADTGVHGWVSIQSVASANLTAPDGSSAVINRASVKK